jgi:S-(hydroxymethyl)glutathione dehydrogenase/alcohol dehydrogenase
VDELDVSTFADGMLVHENAVPTVDPAVLLDRVTLIGCAVTAGLGAVFRSASVQPESTAAVIGCGGVGINAIQGARIADAGRIIAVDRMPGMLSVAEFFGATDIVDASAADPVEQIRDLTGGGVDYSFEAIGLEHTLPSRRSRPAP